MNKLDIIKYLIQSIETEQENKTRYSEELKKAKEKAEKDNNNYSYWHYINYDVKDMVKSKVKNDLKMIRRLTLEIEKEL